MVLLRFEFHQNWLSGFISELCGVEICPSPLTWPLAYTTACTTVQAVRCDRLYAILLLTLYVAYLCIRNLTILASVIPEI